MLAVAREIRAARPEAGLIIFTYLNPILRYGLARFADDAAAAGADGVLVTDMIVEEAAEYLAEMDRVGLAPVFLAAPTSPDDRLEAIATIRGDSFTPSPASASPASSRHDLRCGRAGRPHSRARWSKLPVAVGFGISNAQHVAQVAEFADAAVVGSAIVELIERSTPETAPGEVARFIKGLRQPERRWPLERHRGCQLSAAHLAAKTKTRPGSATQITINSCPARRAES